MSDFWTIGELARACGGGVVGDASVRARGVCTDTRAIEPGTLFIALRGERFDGHDFVRLAAAGGAAAVLVHRDVGEIGVPAVRVRDTGAALAQLGRAWRERLGGTRVVGVTGSNGKTTTVRMIDAVLGARLTGRASIKSFNNAIGVPLTVLGVGEADEYLVAEAGMNAPGEMEPLSDILKPNFAVITSVGRAHIGAFPDGLLGIAREKAAIASHLAPEGEIVATADAPALREALQGDRRVIWVGEGGEGGARVRNIRDTDADVGFTLGDEHFEVCAPGRHNAMNAALAVIVARRMGLDDAAIRAGLARFAPAPMRLEQSEIAGVTIINDAYNANPESMHAALAVLASRGWRGRKVAVLGEMLEMGASSRELHAEVGGSLRPETADLLITVGPGARALGEASGLPHEHFDALGGGGGAERRIASMLERGDLVLLKGSRGVGLERIVVALREAEGMIRA